MHSTSRFVAAIALVLFATSASPAAAQVTDAGAAPTSTAPTSTAPTSTAPTMGAAATSGNKAELTQVNGCVERLPAGSQRPMLREEFPLRGTSGYLAELVVNIEHAAGEKPLPQSVDLQSESDGIKDLQKAGFRFAEGDAGQSPTVEDGPASSIATRKNSRVRLPMVLLPAKGGRQALTLPSLPISIARPNGDIMTLCTGPHRIIVEDATAETPEAAPKSNPAGRSQMEIWESLERALKIAAALVVGAVIGALLLRAWRKRPKVVPPPPPERPPWEVALEMLFEIEHSGLLANNRHADYIDRVNNAVRIYLGARFDFDGLESTTREIEKRMQSVAPPGLSMTEISIFLQECDLVKFAKLEPSEEACKKVFAEGIHMVRITTPGSRKISRAIEVTGEPSSQPTAQKPPEQAQVVSDYVHYAPNPVASEPAQFDRPPSQLPLAPESKTPSKEAAAESDKESGGSA